MQKKIFFWRRYVDHVFIIAKQDHTVEILNQTKSENPAKQFTFEYEADNRPAFTEISIERKEIDSSQEISKTVYRKPTFFWPIFEITF